MKKKILGFTLAIMAIISFLVFMPTNRVAAFPDVSDSHWANKYISSMQNTNIINGYEDGTFRPEQEVKTGEFVKMATLCIWKVNTNVELPEGSHWVIPYAKVANGFLIPANVYTYEDYEKYITREEAVKIVWKLYRLTHSQIKVDSKGEELKKYSDESLITDHETRMSFEYCIQKGLIDGFEDGTLKPQDTLTRAQAAKILSIAK